ncbi:MAG: alcohol dehydrogenase catalytic domain-containing protein [Clostridia bacterium]|nr:alcohol dehydrogenase catalytic domain-containing protein [Clostridia bacterium]
MKAKAAVFMGAEKNFEVREFPVVDAPKGYGRTELIASGICGTDIHFHNGKLVTMPETVIGHEFVGRITDINDEDAKKYSLEKGDNVIADIAVPCGECVLCKSGDDANCVNMQVTNGGSIYESPYLYGGYSEVNFTPLSNLIKIPDSVDPVAAAVFACPGPTVFHSFSLAEKAGVSLSDVKCAVVQGLGPVGIFALIYLKKMGVPKVYAVTGGKNKKRAETAVSLGAEKVLSIARDGAENIINELSRENDGLGVDLCFEASGIPSAVAQGMTVLRNRGVYLIPGQYSNSGGIEIQPQMITFKALHIIGSSQYSVVDVKNYLSFMAEHTDVQKTALTLCSKYSVDRINEAFADAKNAENIKTLLVK